MNVVERFKALPQPAKVAIVVGGVVVGVLIARRRGSSTVTTPGPAVDVAGDSGDFLAPSGPLVGGGGAGVGGDGYGIITDDFYDTPNDPGFDFLAPKQAGPDPVFVPVTPFTSVAAQAAATSPIPASNGEGNVYGSGGYFGNGNTQGYSDAVLAAGGDQLVSDAAYGGTVGRLYRSMWEAASPDQKASPEFVATFNTLVKEGGGTGKVAVVPKPAATPIPVVSSTPVVAVTAAPTPAPYVPVVEVVAPTPGGNLSPNEPGPQSAGGREGPSAPPPPPKATTSTPGDANTRRSNGRGD